MGRPRTPEHLKVVAGTARADRPPPTDGAILIPSLDEMPEMPEWLRDERAQAEWRRLGPILLRYKLLTEANVNAFASLCAIHGVVSRFYADGRFPSPAMMAQQKTLWTEFGLTPASASKARSHGEPGGESKNPFARNGRRQA